MDNAKIILVGADGRMGKTILALSPEKIVYGATLEKPIANCAIAADVVLDFSHPAALDEVLTYALAHKLPVVFAATGYSEADLQKMRLASAQIPVLRSATMSFGVNLILELIPTIIHSLGAGFDVEIVEKHHRNKVDAPSGVALSMAQTAQNAIGQADLVFERHSKHQARTANEVGVSSVRGGTIVGEHTVIFAGEHEVLELTHRAESREVFALGALRAARFLAAQKTPKMYYMKDVLGIGENIF